MNLFNPPNSLSAKLCPSAIATGVNVILSVTSPIANIDLILVWLCLFTIISPRLPVFTPTSFNPRFKTFGNLPVAPMTVSTSIFFPFDNLTL